MRFENKGYGATSFVTGMRAWAALAVVLIHSGGAGLRTLGELGNRIADFGSTGVYAFFVISGFSVCHSYLSSHCFLHYMLKRLVRIVPLYFAFIIFFGLMNDASFENLFMHLIFLSWFDYQTANSILSVEWSIPVEVFWYLFLPSLLIFTRSKWTNIIVLLGVSLCFYFIAELVIESLSISPLALHYSPFRYFFIFSLGVSVFVFREHFLRQIIKKSGVKDYQVSDLIIISVALLILIHWIKPIWQPIFIAGISSALLIMFGHNDSKLSKLIFGNSVIQFLGRISYSIYLFMARNSHSIIKSIYPSRDYRNVFSNNIFDDDFINSDIHPYRKEFNQAWWNNGEQNLGYILFSRKACMTYFQDELLIS